MLIQYRCLLSDIRWCHGTGKVWSTLPSLELLPAPDRSLRGVTNRKGSNSNTFKIDQTWYNMMHVYWLIEKFKMLLTSMNVWSEHILASLFLFIFPSHRLPVRGTTASKKCNMVKILTTKSGRAWCWYFSAAGIRQQTLRPDIGRDTRECFISNHFSMWKNDHFVWLQKENFIVKFQ